MEINRKKWVRTNKREIQARQIERMEENEQENKGGVRERNIIYTWRLANWGRGVICWIHPIVLVAS